MNKKFHSDNKISVAVLAFFAVALLAVGIVLRTRIGTFLETYTEDQTKKQAETHALLMSEKFNSELETLEYIASRLEASPEKLDELMPDIYKDSGEIQGILGIDGVALYGKSLKPSIFEGIQSSFRGNRVVTYVEGEGLLFYGSVILPFVDRFPKDLELYHIMTTKPQEVQEAKEQANE